MAVPDWVGRLRSASFVSPSGRESNFKLDTLSRVGGKKASMHEILNSDEGIPQDQGNRAEEYSIEAYFTGSDGDTEADAFYDSLREKYSTDTPGILRHPSWGDIPVMPFEWQQSHNLITEGGVFRVPVTFRKIPTSNFPVPGQVDASEVIADIAVLEETVEAANESIDDTDEGLYATLRANIQKTVNSIKDALSPIAETVDSINDTFREIESDISYALSIGDDILGVLNQVNNLLETPTQILYDTLIKVDSYVAMGEILWDSFNNILNSEANAKDLLNNILSFQSTFALVTARAAESAFFTDFQTRDEAAKALDGINQLSDLFQSLMAVGVAQSDDGIENSFLPDHDVWLNLTLIVGKANAILIDRSFDLKAKRTIVLSSQSDPLTLTWEYYESTDTEDIEFFINTNKLHDYEMVEIPAGREIVVYE